MARYKEVFDLGQLAPEEKFRKRKVRALRIGIKRSAYKGSPVATVIESLLRGPMRISAPAVIAIKPSVSHPARSLCRLDWSRSPTEEAIGVP